MPAQHFTLDEANALLPEIKPLMAALLERRAKVVKNRHDIADIATDLSSDVGGHVASQMTLDFIAIEQLIHKIRSYGCLIKDLNMGLLDFLSEINGREILLCWRYGEEKIEHYHDLHTGFMERQKIK